MASWVIVATPTELPPTPTPQTQHASTRLADISHFHPYLSALKLTKQLRSVVGMSRASSRPLQRPKSKGQGLGRKHDLAFNQPFHKSLQHPVSTTSSTTPNIPPTHSTTTTIASPQASHTTSPQRQWTAIPRDDSCGSSTMLSTEISDSYVDAEEDPSQSFSQATDDHDYVHLATTSNVDDTSYRAEHDHSAYVDHDAMEDSRSRVTHQRDEVAHQRPLAPDANVDVTAVHDRRQHADKPATSVVNRESVAAIYSLEDKDLAAQFQFIKRVGHGNWGEVWVCRPIQGSGGTIGHASASWSGMGSGGRVAIKLVQRNDNPVSDKQCPDTNIDGGADCPRQPPTVSARYGAR